MDFEDSTPENNGFLELGNLVSNGFIDFSSANSNAPAGIATNKSFRDISNEYATTSPFGTNSTFYTAEYISKNIDFEKLAEFISRHNDADFDYRNFIGYAEKQIIYFGGPTTGVYIDRPTTAIEEDEIPMLSPNQDRYLQLEARLNTEKAKVDITFSNGIPSLLLEFEFDRTKLLAKYKIHCFYEGRQRVYESQNTNQIAFTISTDSYDDFEALLSRCDLRYNNNNFKDIIAARFIKAIDIVSVKEKAINNYTSVTYNPNKFRELTWLYKNIPSYVAKKLDLGQTFKNIVELSEYDRANYLLDTTAPVTSIITKLDHSAVYNHYCNHPQELIDLVHEFDDDAMVKNMCDFLTAAAFLNSGVNPENARVFDMDKYAHIETNIVYGDPNGQIELRNEVQRPLLTIIDFFYKDREINNDKHEPNMFNPMDIIYIRTLNPETGDRIPMPTIALYAKYLGDNTEWNDIKDMTFAAVDIISLITGGFAIKAGLKGAARLIAYIDMAISTINLSLLNEDLKAALNRTPAGKWIVAHWPIISLCTSMGTLSYYLAKGILTYGKQARLALENETLLAKELDRLVEESNKIIKLQGVVTEVNMTLSKAVSHSLEGKVAIQRLDDLDALYKAAKTANYELETLSSKLATETGGKPGFRPKDVNGGLKDRPRALEKIEADYKGDATKILDLAGNKIVYDKVDEIYSALEYIKDKVKLVKFKDRIINPNQLGYRDILMNIEMTNGHIVELRLHFKIMDEAVEKSHKLYEQTRTLEALSEKRALTNDEINLMNILDGKQLKLHNDAWDKIIKQKK